MNNRYPDYGLLVLRVFFGLGIAYHGYGKIFGGSMDQLIHGVEHLGFPLPHVFAWAAALSEFVGGILLALGLGACVPAVLIVFTMSVAAFRVHAGDPFERKELAIAYLIVALALTMTGNGRFSLDRLFRRDG